MNYFWDTKKFELNLRLITRKGWDPKYNIWSVIRSNFHSYTAWQFLQSIEIPQLFQFISSSGSKIVWTAGNTKSKTRQHVSVSSYVNFGLSEFLQYFWRGKNRANEYNNTPNFVSLFLCILRLKVKNKSLRWKHVLYKLIWTVFAQIVRTYTNHYCIIIICKITEKHRYSKN